MLATAAVLWLRSILSDNLLNGALPDSFTRLIGLKRLYAAPLRGARFRSFVSSVRASTHPYAVRCRDITRNMLEDPIPSALVSTLGSTGLVFFPQTCPAATLRLGQDTRALGSCVSMGVSAGTP